MSILRRLFGGGRGATGADGEAPGAGTAGDTETVRKIVARLEALPPERARFVAAFAYVLSRVAHADFEISDAESREMERIVRERGRLPEDQALLVVEIAKAQSRLFGGTENFLVTREFAGLAGEEERRDLLDCLFAVAAAEGGISAQEDAQVRQIASELGFTHRQFVDARRAWSSERTVLKGIGPHEGTP